MSVYPQGQMTLSGQRVLRATKRLFDVVLALLLAPIAVVICLPAMVVISLDTPGGPLFRQARVGHRQNIFILWKLRTMAQGTKHAGSHEVGEQALTRVGGVLRRLKIDELPQIWNVLRGDMSFVGPRPCLPSQTTLILERAARGVFSLRPGITGLAQIRRIDMSTPVLLAQVDAEYLVTRSLRGDIELILGTVAGGGWGDAAKGA